MKSYKSLFVFIMIFISLKAYSQTNIVADSKGSSSLGLANSSKKTNDVSDTVNFNLGMVTFTTKDKKVGLNYYSYFTPAKFTHTYFGISTNSKIKNSVSNVFSIGNVVPEGEIKMNLGFRLFHNQHDWDKLLKNAQTTAEHQEILNNKTKPAQDLWLAMNGSLSGSSFKRFIPDSTFSNQIQKQKFTGYELNVGFNYWNARIIDNILLAGITFGIKQKNNFDDLTESIREDNTVIVDSLSNTSRKIITKETVYTGDYKENIIYPLNFDFYLVPHNLKNLGILGFSRTDISKTEKPKTKLGLGLFFLKEQNSYNPVAGMTFSFSDVFNVDTSDDEKGSFNKFTISITTRINLVNNQKKK